MLTLRTPARDELQTVYRFLDKHLRAQQGWSVLQEYPLAFDPKNQPNIRIVTEGSQILSHAVVKPTMIKTPYMPFQVALIGSVVTAPEHRKQGFSAQLIQECLEHSQKLSCDFAMLWTDLFDFYRRFGFELAGSEVSLVISENFKPQVDPAPLKIMQGRQVDPQAILRLYNRHSTNSLRNAEDIKKFMHIPNSRIYTAWNSNHQMEAYAVEGKGADLQGYIHEWGGNTPALLEIFQHIQKEQQREIIVISPPHCQNLIRQCEDSGARRYEGILAMIKILNKVEMAKKVQRLARRLGVQDFAFEMHGDTLYFGTSEEMFKTDSEADMVQLLFGPTRASDMYQFSPLTAAKLNRVLPLPCWVWGWDSI